MQSYQCKILPLAFCTLFAWVWSTRVVQPKHKPSYFSNLTYTSARERYREIVEKKFKEKDLSYILSLLSYSITCFYDLEIDDARKAFWAAYKIDAGERPEAAKIYDWLVVDSRTVYKLKKRERELVHFYLALCYLFQDNLEEALVEFKKLRQIDQSASKLPIVNFYLGLVYEKLGKLDDALIEYRQLKELADTGSFLFNIANDLIVQVESSYITQTAPNFLDLVIQVDHQSINSIGRTDVYIEGNNRVDTDRGEVATVDSLSSLLSSSPYATLPPIVDSFPVRLSPIEVSRKALQEATAKAARYGLRFLGKLILRKVDPKKGDDLAEEVADITLGKEEENRDIRAWGYAPLNFSFARLRIPATSQQVRLVFHNQNGDMIGFCDYPLQGEKARAIFAARTYFIIAGLAEEFYMY